ncbi:MULTISPECIES: hypothetical protein [unclassified Streptomyces]|uniref:hypothetical protein n=1 Tax=unclassified Streptomyces TaxID=2593676 RepID=UPI00224CD277|nr:hypothetical protein [Streptomyces sp. NBC_01264]MCX4783930.1 hypothetical protein [Streptomyces sp. NBC_01264]
MTLNDVQAASYGFGAIYPVVILDDVHRWHRPTHPGLPEQQGDDGHGMLVLRWTGPHNERAPALLAAAAARAPVSPPTRQALETYRATLPAGLYLITLRSENVLGPWSQRPGADSSAPARHAA